MKKKASGELMLTVTAIIFGVTFVAQRAGMDYIGPFTFNGIRSILGGIILIPVFLVLDKQRKQQQLNAGTVFGDLSRTTEAPVEANAEAANKNLILGGISCGIVFFISSSLQQVGLLYTSAGKAGFITSLYIVIVPVFGIFLKQKIRPILWISVILATTGLYLLSIKEGFSVEWGDVLIFICALGFSIHILLIDYFSPKTDPVKLSSLQFLVCGVVSLPFMFAFETVSWAGIINSWFPIMFAGVMSCGVAYTLQIIAQKRTAPAMTTLILSLESVIALIAGILILGESISVREIIGSSIMFLGILLAQVPEEARIFDARVFRVMGYNKKEHENAQFIEVNYVRSSK